MAHVQHSCQEGGCSVRQSTQGWAVRECLLSTQVPGKAPVLAGQSLVREGGCQRPILSACWCADIHKGQGQPATRPGVQVNLSSQAEGYEVEGGGRQLGGLDS